LDNKKIVKLVIFIIVIFFVFGLIYNFVKKGIDLSKLNNLYKDISILDERISIYYLNNGDIPIKGEKIEFYNSINPNDNDQFYELNLEMLENLNLNYGNRELGDDDFYIINEQSHTIYYKKGVLYNEYHYTRNLKYEKVKFRNTY
jgi:hypothetical protein